MRKILYHEDEKQQFYTKLNQNGIENAIFNNYSWVSRNNSSNSCRNWNNSLIVKSMRKFFHNDLIEACVKEYKKVDINAKEV